MEEKYFLAEASSSLLQFSHAENCLSHFDLESEITAETTSLVERNFDTG